MTNKIRFTTQSVSGSLSKGNARINMSGPIGPTHRSGFYAGINPPVNGYTFYMKKTGGIIDDGLILYLDAGNTASYRSDISSNEWWDISGNGNDINLYNGISFNSTYNSLDFDGTNNYGKTNNILVSSPTGLTIGGWIMKKNVGIGTYECALHQSVDTSIGSSSYWMGFETSTNNLCATIGSNTNGQWMMGLTTTVAQFDTWYYLVASWDGSIVKVYINGIYNKQYNLASYSNLTTPTRIGASGDASGYLFGGEIGNIFIYNRGLTESEILQNFNVQKSRFGL